jgi:hypothetical protein
MKCRSCGADNSADVVTCNYCGSHLPMSASTEKTAIFARIKSSDEYRQGESPERQARLPKYGAVQKTFLLVFFAMFVGGGAIMSLVLLGMAGVFGFFGSEFEGGFGAAFSLAPLCMAIVPLGFVGLGIFLFLKTRKKMNSIENDPVQAIAVIVTDKRTHVSGGSGDSSARTNYFITCETEDGNRKEYQVWDGNMYGRISSDDAGVLFVRAGYGLDFDRVAL